MLRKLIVGVIVANFVFMLVGVLTTFDRNQSGIAVAAGNNTASFGVGASVPQFLEVNAVLRTVTYNTTTGVYDIDWNSSPSSLDFGTLAEVNNTATGAFYYMAGANGYAVVMYPVSSGRAFTIQETGTVLTNGGGATIPSAAYVMTPDYQTQDLLGTVAQGSMPAGASLATPRSAVGTSSTVYTSDASGTAKAVRAFLAITGPDSSGYIRNYAQGHNGSAGVGAAQYYQGNGQNNWQPVTKNQPSGSYTGSVTFTVNLQ